MNIPTGDHAPCVNKQGKPCNQERTCQHPDKEWSEHHARRERRHVLDILKEGNEFTKESIFPMNNNTPAKIENSNNGLDSLHVKARA